MDALISPRRRTLVQALGAAGLLAACGSPAPAKLPAWQYRGPTMGSTYQLTVAGRTLTARVAEAANDAVAAALDAVERAMSTHRADSELSRLNAHASRVPFALSEATFAVLALAEEVSVRSGGAFDVTVAPYVDAWGFGPDRRPRRADANAIVASAGDVGFPMLALDAARRSAAKAQPGVRADLSGIAKGFGVDRAAQALEALGIEHYLVEAGGEVRTKGLNAHGEPWRVAIEQPDAWPARPHRVVPMSGLAMATSGDYRIYFEQDGRRYCHEIDPSTAAPIANGVASVSVVARECAYADAMATALMVMGVERGAELARSLDLAAYWLVRTPDGLQPHASDAFARLGSTAVG